MKLIIIILFSIVYSFSLIPYIKVNNKKIINNLLNISTLVFILIYGIIFPLNYILTILGYNSEKNIIIYSKLEPLDFIIQYIVIMLVSHSFLFTLKHTEEIKINNSEEKDKKIDLITIKITAFILLAIGVISNYLYLKEYGGFANYLKYSKLIRSGVMLINNKFSFIYPFRNCILFASFLYALLYKNKKKNLFLFLMLAYSVIMSVTILYSNNGRMGILIYIILIFNALKKSRYSEFIGLKRIVQLGSVLLISALIITFIGFKLGRNNNIFFLNLINDEISFIFLNFSRIKDYCNITNYRYFFDTISFVFYIFPSSIWSNTFKITTSSTVNTIAWYGSAKGSNGIYGEMPIDFVSLSYIQFGIIGIFILPSIFAIFYNKIFRIVKKIDDNNLAQFIKIYILISIGINSMFYADPYLTIKRNWGFILFLIIYKIVENIIKNKNKNKKEKEKRRNDT